MTPNALTDLRLFIINSYELDDVRTLCTDLGIIYDDLAGDRISTKVERLLYLVGQLRRYDDLLLVLRRTRPQAFEQGGLGQLTSEALMEALPVYAGEQVDGISLVTVHSKPKKHSGQSIIVSRYEQQEELGRGSFAVVYKALDTNLDRPVALKVLHPYWQESPQFVARFKLEAQTAASLRHPNIVRVIDFGQGNDDRLFMIMEYLPGQTLRDYQADFGNLKLSQALPILKQLASALDYAHSQGVVHRDLKPSNIIIEEKATDPLVTLTDFGLVKAMEGSVALTVHANALVGSPEYMAPEQADPNRHAEVGPPADRYALGVLAYKLLTGRVPFPGNSAATLYAHEHKSPPSPRKLQPNLPEEAEIAILTMLAKAPAERFPSCSSFITALIGSLPYSLAEDLATTYERLLQAMAAEDWLEVLMLGGQIRGVNPYYHSVDGHIARAKEALIQANTKEILQEKKSDSQSRLTTYIANLSKTLSKQNESGRVPTVPREELAKDAPDYSEHPTTSLSHLGDERGVSREELPGLDTSQQSNFDVAANSLELDFIVNPRTGKTMVLVPAGPFRFGKKKKEQQLSEFWIDRTPVTNAEYARFIVDKGHKPPNHWHGKKEPPTELSDHPVVFVTWEDADAYAKWAGGRLPSEEEWEKAARGMDGRLYPWGDEWKDGLCNTKEANVGKTTPVGQFSPAGDSPYGCMDMSGNVWEWINQKYVLKGGSWEGDQVSAQTPARFSSHWSSVFDYRGFRVVVEASSISTL